MSTVHSNRFRSNGHPQPTPAQKLGGRLSPRRKLYLKRFLDWLEWHGRKVHLDESRLQHIEYDLSMDTFDMHLAVDDGYALGLLEVHIIANDVQSVTLLSSDLGDAR